MRLVVRKLFTNLSKSPPPKTKINECKDVVIYSNEKFSIISTTNFLYFADIIVGVHKIINKLAG